MFRPMKKKARSCKKIMIDSFLNLDIEDTRWSSAVSQIEKVSEDVKNAVFDYVAEHTESEVLHSGLPVIVNVCLSSDERVHALNKEFRGMDKPTNVLSFANVDFEGFAQERDLYQEIELGDIIIAFETMQKEADIEGISLHDHYCHLLTHGLLHLLGFDHQTEEEAEYMEGFEIEILQSMGIANPYKEN